MREKERPRGSAVWVGLDHFGDTVVSRLPERWFTDDAVGQALHDANQVLAGVRIVAETHDELDLSGGLESDTLEVHDNAPPPEQAGAIALRRIERAVATLLAAQQSREALQWADREVLTPHVWLVADLCAPETASLAEWLEQLHDRLDELHVEARLFLLLRHLSWGLDRAAQVDAAERMQALVEHLVGEATPGRVNIMAYVLTDRDSVGGYYDEAKHETINLAYRFTDLMMLTDAAHGNAPGAEYAFMPPATSGSGTWETLPIFASAAATCLHWDTPALVRNTAEKRRKHLFAVLSAGVPPTYDPEYPVLGRVALADDGRWPRLDVPRWAPRFWNTPQREFERYRTLLEAWLPKAEAWRHEMLVVHRDRCRLVDRHAATTLAAYEDAIADQERSILSDDSLRGFFAPLHRLYDRSIADLQVQQLELRTTLDTPPPPIDAVAVTPAPSDALARADDTLASALERKINPFLLVQVTIMTSLIVWALVTSTLIAARDFFAEVGGQAALFIRFPWFRDFIAALPENAQIMTWTAIATLTLFLAIAGITVLRQRVHLERAWNIPYRRALRWRDDIANSLPRDVRGVEQALAKANLQHAEAMIGERRVRVAAFEAHGLAPLDKVRSDDGAVSRVMLPGAWTAQSLSDLQISQIVAAFKRTCAQIPSAQWTPEYLLRALFAEAAEQAGDPLLDLRLELIPIRRSVLRAMPPDGAVRVQQLSTTAPAERNVPPVVRFLAVPAGLADEFRFETEVAVVLPLPIDTRFYAAVLQTGMSARRILSRSTPWSSDPLNTSAPSLQDAASAPATAESPSSEARALDTAATGLLEVETPDAAQEPLDEPAAAMA